MLISKYATKIKLFADICFVFVVKLDGASQHILHVYAQLIHNTIPSEPARAVSTAIRTLNNLLQLICFAMSVGYRYRLIIGVNGQQTAVNRLASRTAVFRFRYR